MLCGTSCRLVCCNSCLLTYDHGEVAELKLVPEGFCCLCVFLDFAVDSWVCGILGAKRLPLSTLRASAMAHLLGLDCVCAGPCYSGTWVAGETDLPSKKWSNSCWPLVRRGYACELHWPCNLCLWCIRGFDRHCSQSSQRGRI